eukprot:gb/GEZN01022084.1/.p1 GENE.gb/GEZN01022084.1/~~gb/GEZN01022084.1/.p1  ORF type:complete len:157 (-),score=32.89 gb/GEZN01022084.1/:142-612(-)
MPVYGVSLQADLEGVKELEFSSTSWNLSVKCGCGEVNKNVWVDSADEKEMKGSKGIVNLVVKCKGCARTNCATWTAHKKVKKIYTAEDSGKEVLMGAFDCRGIEPVKWILGPGFVAEGAGGAKFPDVDLSEEFYEYDESAETAVEIKKMKTSVTKL